MKSKLKQALILVVIIISVALSGINVYAADDFEISGWIPYWRVEDGIQSIVPNLSNFTEVNPFVYTVRQDGTLFEASTLTEPEWIDLRKKAEAQSIRFIPTVIWANSDAIHDVLSDPKKRQGHIGDISWEIYRHNLDGIDIDYEAKYAKTRPYFSLFLKELQEAIGYDKWIMCTIEARTPLDSRYSSPESIPKDIEYANDFAEINKYCDRVRIIAYDQGRFDLKLNDANDHPYVPVADRDWVSKVVQLTAEEIDKDKIVIGVPTYGYEYDMFLSEAGTGFPVALNLGKIGQTKYSRLWSFNPGYALAHAEKLNLTPIRNSAGELSLIYPAKDSSDPDAIPLTFSTRIMSWSDAEAIREKAELAKELGVRGIAIFKIDGGQDPALWNVLAEYKAPGEFKKTAKVIIDNNDLSILIPANDLEFGSIDEDVRTLQKLLNAKGFIVSTQGAGSPGNETNVFGSATQGALIAFQKANNIYPAVGYFGPKTRASFTL